MRVIGKAEATWTVYNIVSTAGVVTAINTVLVRSQVIE
jgi:hypothetical protein